MAPRGVLLQRLDGELGRHARTALQATATTGSRRATETRPAGRRRPGGAPVRRLRQGQLLHEREVAALRQRARTSCPGASTSRARVFGKQGGPYPVSLHLAAGARRHAPRAGHAEVDTERYGDVWDLDLRLAKTIKLGGSGPDARRRVVQRVQQRHRAVAVPLRQRRRVHVNGRRARSPAGLGRIEEILVPSIFRFGARFTF